MVGTVARFACSMFWSLFYIFHQQHLMPFWFPQSDLNVMFSLHFWGLFANCNPSPPNYLVHRLFKWYTRYRILAMEPWPENRKDNLGTEKKQLSPTKPQQTGLKSNFWRLGGPFPGPGSNCRNASATVPGQASSNNQIQDWKHRKLPSFTWRKHQKINWN